MARKRNNRPNFQVLGEDDEGESSAAVESTDHHSHSENPRAVPVNAVLTGDNFLPWSHAIKRSLIAKEKLSFITDSLKPEKGTNEYSKWEKSDCLVTSWILNLMLKEISEDFLYVESSRDLWLELEQRFGDTNGPLLYQLKRNLSLISQGDLTVMQYFAKIKKLWSELSLMRPDPQCVCGCCCNAFTKINEYKEDDKLMQFLMGLSDVYENAINQILLMDPLPSINRAYSMIVRVEKQKQVILDNVVDFANFTRSQQHRKRNFGPNSSSKSKNSLKPVEGTRPCSHCGGKNHSEETCFDLHGIPDWYIELQQRRQRQSNFQAHNAYENANSDDSEEDTVSQKQFHNNYKREKQQQSKAKGKAISETPLTETDFTAFAGSAGFLYPNTVSYNSG